MNWGPGRNNRELHVSHHFIVQTNTCGYCGDYEGDGGTDGNDDDDDVDVGCRSGPLPRIIRVSIQ